MSKSINNGAIEKKRAVALDLARGTMLLLIVLAHAPLYLYAADPGIMHRVESGSFFDQIVNLFGIFIIDNRARAMFAVLLSYGLVLAFEGQISKGKNENHAVNIVRRRSWYLILFGIVLAVLIGGQDILMAYGVAGLLVSPLLKCKMKTLIRTFTIITILYIIFIPIIWGFNMQAIGHYGFSPDVSAKDTYLSTTMLRLLFFPVIPVLIHFMFPIIPSVILGLWIARYQLLIKPEQHLKKLYFITIIGLAISLIGALPLSFIGIIWYPSVFTAGMVNGIHILTGIVGGLAYATGFGIIGSRLKNLGYFSRSLIALGKRSLTFFVLNEALLVILLSPVAFDLGGHVSNAFAALIAVSIWILSVILATIMEKNNLNGPLEMLLRRLIYKNKKNERRPEY
ncbi:DUF418 domain-containing protein [Bacillus cereus group sp. TH152-1LC]|uniref:DUF418 domain-containing protein n=1 Tax=Bacillus cereus group sp. TH152-1LC TaxID=3018060 RepID=UPI0022E97E6C|nr:DUF418 domain-containing protein [Bacillus cereus group sp. TH152-1LC]MDA1677816.1 DUF418 domain-containing protein [Bacillus cereus group sp. TH152-1LC]